MQTILGSGGAIGIELAQALKPYTGKIRLVSRNPQAVNPDYHLFSADLTKPADVVEAVDGSDSKRDLLLNRHRTSKELVVLSRKIMKQGVTLIPSA
jgi:hypothetical protein